MKIRSGSSVERDIKFKLECLNVDSDPSCIYVSLDSLPQEATVCWVSSCAETDSNIYLVVLLAVKLGSTGRASKTLLSHLSSSYYFHFTVNFEIWKPNFSNFLLFNTVWASLRLFLFYMELKLTWSVPHQGHCRFWWGLCWVLSSSLRTWSILSTYLYFNFIQQGFCLFPSVLG